MLEVNLSVVGILLSICLAFGGFYLANRITDFGATPAFLAVVAVINILLCLIPKIGWVISLIATFILLRTISRNGVLLMMITSWIMMFLIVVGVGKIL